MTATPRLNDRVVARIFDRLLGAYGNQFTTKFSRVENDVDVGILGAKEAWAEELAGFADKLDAIAGALKNLPIDFPPNAPQFADLCRDVAKRIGPKVPSLTHKQTPEEVEHQRVMAKRLGDSIGAGKIHDGIDTHWATHPRSAAHLAFIFDAADRDHRFKACIEQMVSDGICTADGHLLKTYRDGAFV